MKKQIAVSLTLCLILTALSGCGNAAPTASQAAPAELTVFAAASLTETLEEIAGLYQKAAPEVSLVFNFDSSGTLKTQIAEGAVCDVFISAAPKQMNQLDGSRDAEHGNPDGLDLTAVAQMVHNGKAEAVFRGMIG